MKRYNFIRSIALIGIAALLPVRSFSLIVATSTTSSITKALDLLIELIQKLKLEGSNIVRKTLNGKRYRRNEAVHYPFEDSIEDTKTHCQVFFHAHRKYEYGHFHTFVNNEKGELVHLIMISMDKNGKPIALSTLNRWVTGDFFVKSNELKLLFDTFRMNHTLFPDKRIIEFIENIFLAYREQIFELFDERDKTVTKYVEQNTREPFEDRDVEILSSRKINLYFPETQVPIG
jgi:hypothetical protein